MLFDHDALTTPAFVYDWDRIEAALRRLAPFRVRGERQLLYSIKAVPLLALLHRIKPWVDGFAVSSEFEARLAREVLSTDALIQLTTPGLNRANIGSLSSLCNQISFNSISQWSTLVPDIQQVSCGLRLNPGIATGLDPRHDPCRANSKLGVSIALLNEAWQMPLSECFDRLAGLHIHTSFNALNLKGLEQAVAQLEAKLSTRLAKLEWINLGGGYRFEDTTGCAELIALAERLSRTYGLRVLVEPGHALVGAAGCLITEVIDIFTSDDKKIAVLDTTVSHLPRVFEYQYTPTVQEASPNGAYEYLLAGSSCLAGDLFGVYAFEQPLRCGSRLTFLDVGAYMLVKASCFNGINLPQIYMYSEAGGLESIKEYTYEDYRRSWTR